MGKISNFLSFLAGAAIGGFGTWYYVREKYARISEEEIASVKETYARREETVEQESAPEQDTPKTRKVPDKPDITDYAKRVQSAGYVDYSRTVGPKSAPTVTPYVISPDEFGEIEEYAVASLFYFTDGVLADEYGEVVADVEEIIGDALSHFGEYEYEEDSVFVRSDARRCDYEILRDLREFSEFLKTLPPRD